MFSSYWTDIVFTLELPYWAGSSWAGRELGNHETSAASSSIHLNIVGTGPKHGADMLSYLDPSNQCSRLSDRLSIFPTQQTEQTMGIKNVFRCRVDNFVFCPNVYFIWVVRWVWIFRLTMEWWWRPQHKHPQQLTRDTSSSINMSLHHHHTADSNKPLRRLRDVLQSCRNPLLGPSPG